MNLPVKLFHYSEKPIEKLRQDFHDAHWKEIPIFNKPHGVWVSVEDYVDDENWKTWCESENFRLDGLTYRYFVKIKHESKILHITNTKELESFSLKYKGNNPADSYVFNIYKNSKAYIYIIEWNNVLEEYDGIIIAPYNWECRCMNSTTSWYNGWDCASGCIWNIDVIESMELCPAEENAMDSQ